MFAPWIGRVPSDTTPDTTYVPVSTSGPVTVAPGAAVVAAAVVWVGAVGGETCVLQPPVISATQAPATNRVLICITILGLDSLQPCVERERRGNLHSVR